MTEAETKMLSDALVRALKQAFPGGSPPLGGGRKDSAPRGNKDEAIAKNRVRATTKSMDSLFESVGTVDRKFRHLDKTLKATIKQFGTLNRSIGGSTTPTNQPLVTTPVNTQEVEKAAKDASDGLADVASRAAILGTAFYYLGNLIKGPIADVTRDYYQLLSRGVSASSNLWSFYKSAAAAGMSLQEYTGMLEENSAAVVRAGSFADFDRTLGTATKQLNGLGIFGAAAQNLAATMASSTVTLGIPMAQQEEAMNAQIDTFNMLRKTTMMTADSFKELIVDLSNNQHVQEELMGLAPDERKARMDQIIQGASVGQQMGLTKDASKGLTEALLAQRKLTAKERFKAAGSIRQAGSLIGMSSQDSDELARLTMVKNKDPAQMKRFTELSGTMKMGLERLQNSGSLSAQHIADTVESTLGEGGQTQIQAEAAKALLTAQSGPVKNTETGKGTSQNEQTVGNVLTLLTGITKNPLFEGGAMLVQMGVQTGALWYINKTLISGFASLRGALMGKSLPDAGPGKMGKLGGMISGLGGGGKFGLVKGALGIGMALNGIIGAVTEMFTGDLQAALGEGDGWADKFGGMLMGFVRGIFTSFTGIIDAVFGTNLTNSIDQMFAGFSAMWEDAKATAYGWLAGMTFGDMSKGFKDLQKQSETAAAKSRDVQSQLEQDKTQTLVTIGAKNIEDLKKQKEAAEKAAKELRTSFEKVNGSTVEGTQNLVGAIKSDVAVIRTAQAGAAQAGLTSTAAVIATPGQTPINTVTQPDVNKSKAEQAKTASEKTTETSAVNNQQLVVDLLQQQLAVAQRLLDVTIQSGDDSLTQYLKRGSLANTQLLTDNFNNPYA